MTKLALDSPGWTRPATIIYRLYLWSGIFDLSSNSFASISSGAPFGFPLNLLTYEVMVSSGTSSPLSE